MGVKQGLCFQGKLPNNPKIAKTPTENQSKDRLDRGKDERPISGSKGMQKVPIGTEAREKGERSLDHSMKASGKGVSAESRAMAARVRSSASVAEVTEEEGDWRP